MQAWAKDQKVGLSMLTLMGDPAGDLTKALDMELTHPGPKEKGLYGRCKRHAIHAVNGVIKTVRISEGPNDPAGDDDPSATLADAMLEAIEQE
jgi:peroxiredoxin